MKFSQKENFKILSNAPLKSEKKKKKKKVLRSFSYFFLLPFQIFPFTIFLPIFPSFLASLFLVGQQKFPGEKHHRGTLPPMPPGCYTTASECVLFIPAEMTQQKVFQEETSIKGEVYYTNQLGGGCAAKSFYISTSHTWMYFHGTWVVILCLVTSDLKRYGVKGHLGVIWVITTKLYSLPSWVWGKSHL